MPLHSERRQPRPVVVITPHRALLSLALGLAALGALALVANLDPTVALRVREAVDAVGGLRKFLSLAEIGGHGKGALMVLVAAGPP